MLVKPVASLPSTGHYEVKWDGYRCMTAVLDDGSVQMVSRRGASLGRAFPELVAAVRRDFPRGTLVDGEVVVWEEGRLSFERLQQRACPLSLARGHSRVACVRSRRVTLLHGWNKAPARVE
ncbi:hypothetical protein ACH4PU_33350 [Streptomyces sp. NPDC021100]|uniref:ATP-dependent DNA ligase n=1 Tax=Streptomyces sp. NPDC021100 TaxID=3365114 RepID=UPI00378DDD5B